MPVISANPNIMALGWYRRAERWNWLAQTAQNVNVLWGNSKLI